jgi:hypothetical protein
MRALLAGLSLFIVTCVASLDAVEPPRCTVPEIVPGNSRYNQLLCLGVEYMERREFRNAIPAFEEAMRIPLSDVPNFQLFARLALAYYWAGDSTKARENAERARLSLLVLTGAYRCEETRSTFVLVDRRGHSVDHPDAPEIARRMCGAAYDQVYEDASLESFVSKARLVENYLTIARTMTSP